MDGEGRGREKKDQCMVEKRGMGKASRRGRKREHIIIQPAGERGRGVTENEGRDEERKRLSAKGGICMEMNQKMIVE